MQKLNKSLVILWYILLPPVNHSLNCIVLLSTGGWTFIVRFTRHSQKFEIVNFPNIPAIGLYHMGVWLWIHTHVWYYESESYIACRGNAAFKGSSPCICDFTCYLVMWQNRKRDICKFDSVHVHSQEVKWRRYRGNLIPITISVFTMIV